MKILFKVGRIDESISEENNSEEENDWRDQLSDNTEDYSDNT